MMKSPAFCKRRAKPLWSFPVSWQTPPTPKVQEGAKLARENRVDMILAVGGGSR